MAVSVGRRGAGGTQGVGGYWWGRGGRGGGGEGMRVGAMILSCGDKC